MLLLLCRLLWDMVGVLITLGYQGWIFYVAMVLRVVRRPLATNIKKALLSLLYCRLLLSIPELSK
jgi:hypothetical protein